MIQEEIVYEVSDLIYHLLVLLANKYKAGGDFGEPKRGINREISNIDL